MKSLKFFRVRPIIPDELKFIEELSTNYWWSWHHDAAALFRRINPVLWQKVDKNPVVFLNQVPQDELYALIKDQSFLDHQTRVKDVYTSYHAVSESHPLIASHQCIAYFCAEFGIHNSLRIFSGGLGVLAGDFLKTASDRILPMVGIGILYRQGFGKQLLSHDGIQHEYYPDYDFHFLPVRRARNQQGELFEISIPIPNDTIKVNVWKAQVGRVELYLLDTNLSDNPEHIRNITAQLYGGDSHNRWLQEILLGIGGVKALQAMGIKPMVYHMNEGHSALLSLERMAQVIQSDGIEFKTACELIARTNVFTTHTPVEAGHDVFKVDMIYPYMELLAPSLETSVGSLIALGQPPGASSNADFSMTILALKLAQYCNGVSKLHGQVTRSMMHYLWPEKPKEEIPITHITNAVHPQTWVSTDHAKLYDHYLGSRWHHHDQNTNKFDYIDEIPPEEIWQVHELRRNHLINHCRQRLTYHLERLNAPRSQIDHVQSVLNRDVLTIGYARRFTAYKRATLLFRDPQRLEKLLNDKEGRIQFIFAGKAHQKDIEGKKLIKDIIDFSRRDSIRSSIIFVEDYDMELARVMIQGVDVWLNTPRRPLEASGTSGMKAAMNGVLNASVLDGWWCEGYQPDRGWTIGNGYEHTDVNYQDEHDSLSLYHLLEEVIVPIFYDRPNSYIPLRWVEMMKKSIKMGLADFNSNRMMYEYETKFYHPAIKQYQELTINDYSQTKGSVQKIERMIRHWPHIKISQPSLTTILPNLKVGDHFEVKVEVYLGELTPSEVEVQLYIGEVGVGNEITTSNTITMTVAHSLSAGHYIYTSVVTCPAIGRFGFSPRVVPNGDDRIKHSQGLITWPRDGEK